MKSNIVKRKIVVLSIIPYKVLPAKLGGEKGIALFNKYLGREVELLSVATANNDAGEAENYTVLPILSNSRSRYINLLLIFKIRKLVRHYKATHLLIEHPYFGWLAYFVRKLTGIVWVVHSHNLEYMRSKSIGRKWWKALKWYEKWVYKNADINFFISEDDLQAAVAELNIDSRKSHAITYGIEVDGPPEERHQLRNKIKSRHNIGAQDKILLFNGALYHHTNYDALSAILEHINPMLLLNASIRYKIIVCGRGLPSSFNELADYKDKNVVYAGFVDDINEYFMSADVFLNSILSGGGVKTKAIEALSMNCTVVSTEIGALGLNRSVCGNKLHVVADGDWTNFYEKTVLAMKSNEEIPATFFEYYYWGNISKRVAAILQNHAQPY